MAPIALDIDDDQRFALMKFRRNVRDLVKPGQDDYYLLRWLRARNWKTEDAEKMLRESMQWREEWKVDTLHTEWVPPEFFGKYYPSGVSGYDREGSPVIVVPFAGLDMWGVIHSARRADFIRYTLRMLEEYLRLAHEQSNSHGVRARQLVAIIDMEGFNMKQYVYRPAGELIVALIKMYEANYPEILKACYIINVSRMFSIAFSLIKNFLHAETLSKIHMYKSDKKKYLNAFLTHIDPDQIPKFYGGTQVDENGDEKCSAKIRQGGKIPKSYYYRKPEKKLDEISDTNFTITEIKKSGKVTLTFDASQPNSILKYEFKTEGVDIRFGVTRVSENGEEVEEIELHKVNSTKTNELGVLTHETSATYKVTFDNSSNLLRSAKVHHAIQVLPPLTERQTPAPQPTEGL